jgi:hypothetical protein
VLGQIAYAEEIGFLRAVREPPQLHIPDHFLAQLAHGDASVVGLVGAVNGRLEAS